MTPGRIQPGAAALAVVAGVSLWLSLGVLAITSPQFTRVGALPPISLLALSVTAAAALAWVTRLRTQDAWPLTLLLVLWFPWLPIDLPPAVLLWEGPLEALVWCAAIGGVVAARAAPAIFSKAWFCGPVKAPRFAAVMFAACALAAGVRLQELLPGGDEPHYLIITQSLLDDGDLQIENNHARADYREYLDVDIPPHSLRRGVNGEIYSVHAPGVSALLLPAYAIAGYPGALVTVAVLCAVAIAALWRIAYALTGSAAAAWAGVTAVGGSATYFFHSFTIFPDPFGAAIVTCALLLLTRLELEPDDVTRTQLAIGGMALALMPWLHTRFVILAAGFGAVIAGRVVRRDDRTSALLAFLAVPILSAALWFTFFAVIYGTPDPAASYGGSKQSAWEWMPAGITGLAFDQQFGLVANAPVYALLPLGVVALLIARRRFAVEIALAAIPYAMFVAAFGMWWGGWSAPGRFLTACTPIAVILLAAAWHHGGRTTRSAFAAFSFLGLANIAGRLAWQDGALLYNYRDGIDRLLEYASRTAYLPFALPSVHRIGVEPSLLLASIWTVTTAAALLVSSLLLRSTTPLALRWTVVGWAVGTAVMVAATASWPAAGVRAFRGPVSQLEFLRLWDPKSRPIVLRLPEARSVSAGDAVQEIVRRSLPREWDRAATNGALMREATRVQRYGSVRVFALDVNTYVEREGIWTRGEDEATLVVTGNITGSVDVRVRAGPVPASAEFEVSGTNERVALGSSESRVLRLPPGVWRTRTSGRFRPIDHDPATHDARWLGVRLEFQ